MFYLCFPSPLFSAYDIWFTIYQLFFHRDRVPFVLTQDMLHVLNTYSKDVTNLPYGVNNSSGFGYTPGHGSSHSQQGVQIFIDRCCEAYNLLRHRSYQLISLLELVSDMNKCW